MTEPIPLTGTDLEIAHRITAGQHPAHIEHVGWFRSAWSPADVRRVARRLALFDLYRKEQRAREVPERVPRVRKECGTVAGHALHQKRKERICDACGKARLKALQRKKAARKPGPKPLPTEHGTERGYYQHRRRKDKVCDPCLAALSASKKKSA